MISRLISPALIALRSSSATIVNHRSVVWIIVAAAPVVVMVIAGWRLGTTVIPLTLDAETRLSELRQIQLQELFADNTSALDGLRQKVTEINADIPPAVRFVGWVGRFSPAFSWLPGVQREMAAWASQTRRVEMDLDAAIDLLDSSSRLLDIYTATQNTLLTTSAGPSGSQLRTRVLELGTSLDDSLSELDDAVQLGRNFSLALQAPRVRDLSGRLGDLEDQMMDATMLGRDVSVLLGELLDLAEGARPLIGQFVIDGYEPEPLTGESLKATLTSVNERARSAKQKAEVVANQISDNGQADWLTSRLSALDQVLSVLIIVGRAGTTGLGAVDEALEAMNSSDGGLLDRDNGVFEIFDSFMEHEDEIATSISGLEQAQRILEDLKSSGDSAFAGSGLADVSRLVGELRTGLQMALDIAPVGESLLARDGVRKYLVLGQSADELRAIGGFVSSIWLVTFEDGSLVDVKYHDSVRVDDWDRLLLYPKAPAGLEEHMNAWVWLLRDVSWDPDFPTTARSAADMFKLAQRQDVDGVIAINQWTLLRVIEGLGSIPSVSGNAVITPRNLLSNLEQGTDLHGRAYMDLILQGLLDRINQPMSLPALIRLASSLHDTLQSRDMLVFFDDQSLQSVMGELGWDGRVRQDSPDYLYVVDSNVGWSKVDRNVERDISYVVDLSRGPQPRVSLTLGYVNHSGPGSPGCEPQWLNRGNDYSQLKNACYWNYFRVYTPLGARLLSETPLPLAEYSVSVEIGRGVPGQNTGNVSSSHNKIVFAGLTQLSAGDRGEVDLVYDLPASVVRRDGDRLTYELLIQKQPGVRQRDVKVEFLSPSGYHLASSAIAPVEVDGSRIGFRFLLTRDTVLSVEFERDSDGPG